MIILYWETIVGTVRTRVTGVSCRVRISSDGLRLSIGLSVWTTMACYPTSPLSLLTFINRPLSLQKRRKRTIMAFLTPRQSCSVSLLLLLWVCVEDAVSV